MNRRFLTLAAASCIAAVTFAPQASFAGGYTVATAECATNGAVITWKHIEEARLQGLTGVTRTAEIVSVKVFQEDPPAASMDLTTTSIGTFVWTTAPFSLTGTVFMDVTFRDTTVPPSGPTDVQISGPHRVSFSCTAPPAPSTTTTIPATTTTAPPAPTTAPAAPTTAPAAPTTTLVPATTAAAPTTVPLATALPQTGSSDRVLVLGGAFLLLAGSTLTLSTQLRRRSA